MSEGLAEGTGGAGQADGGSQHTELRPTLQVKRKRYRAESHIIHGLKFHVVTPRKHYTIPLYSLSLHARHNGQGKHSTTLHGQVHGGAAAGVAEAGVAGVGAGGPPPC